MNDNTYLIGIDLGTTNCTVSYIKEQNDSHTPLVINQLEITQNIAANEIGTSLSLPSFIYFPLTEELKAARAELPWNSAHTFTSGTFARERGTEVPHRLIASAKSWLCHHGVDRRQQLLPIEIENSSLKISPLQACAEILRHLRDAWNFDKSDAPFNEQTIFVTVPASFDPSARQLVQEAAALAGYPEITLMEEPQAAFYAWLSLHSEEWRKQLKVGDCVLVVDIGGGTTDFSLIAVEEHEGNLQLRRQAVGAHLLLGGDNIDLGLAYLAKTKFEEQGSLVDDKHLQSLVHQCRRAKELFLSDNPPEKLSITLLGKGSRLIANTLTTELTEKEVRAFVLNGYLPFVEPSEKSATERRLGLQQVGLPYVQDPRISAQLAKFLSMTGENDSAKIDQFVLPTAVLFNGGTLKAAAIRKEIMALLNRWANNLGKQPVVELPEADYDFAVSKGAAYYGRVRRGHALRIKSGTSRSYYLGVEDALPSVPGMPPPLRAICIVPFGMEEGEERELINQEFFLVLGEQATFRFFSHATPYLSDGREPVVGTVVRNWQQELTELHPIETVLDKSTGDGKTVCVKLISKVTELGVLELWCVAQDKRRWKLEFDIRKNI